MLKKLFVSNYVLIDELEIDFSSSINIITGETGAGKSILLGALSLILGQRADSKTLYDSENKCIIEGTFYVANYNLESFFAHEDIDYEDITIIRRELTPSGKSRSFVNDTPVNLQILKQLGMQLVNVHSQHETLALNNRQFQLDMLDIMTGHDTVLKEFRMTYSMHIELNKKLEKLLDENQGITDLDYLNFQHNELQEADLKEEEQESLEASLKLLENAEEIRKNLLAVNELLSESESSAIDVLSEANTQLRNASRFSDDLMKLYERLESVLIELQDIATEVEQSDTFSQTDPEELEKVNDRLNTLYRLQQKHQVQSVDELLELQDSFAKQLENIEGLSEEIEQLHKQIETSKKQLLGIGETITKNRSKTIPKVEKLVMEKLVDVGIPNAQFRIQMEELPFEKITSNGLDKITFLFSANKGTSLDALHQVASGGELSRLMLVLKSLIASNSNLPTLIFDEIDAGISGEVAFKVGHLLNQVGKKHQVLLITHLPQIARLGKDHFYVYKEIKNERTVSRIKHLNEAERVEELAKMIGGENFSKQSEDSAKELLHH